MNTTYRHIWARAAAALVTITLPNYIFRVFTNMEANAAAGGGGSGGSVLVVKICGE